MTFSTGAAGGVDIACDAGAGFGAGFAGVAANATEVVAATPASVALAAATAMSLRLEPFKVFLSNDGFFRRAGGAGTAVAVWGLLPAVPRAG
ncbi:hypothetical protein ACWD0A_00125 [Streptomyces sp. NPDC002867]